MTKEDIINMAREAELICWLPNTTFTSGVWLINAGEPADELERFAALVSAAKCKELADQIDKMPFGDTAASFAVWIREQA